MYGNGLILVQKVRAKELLEKHFEINNHYIKLLSLEGKQTTHTKGGQNRQILIHLKIFKYFKI